MSTLTLAGQDVAHQLYELLRAVDATPSGQATLTLRERAEQLRARCAELLASEDAREQAAASLVRALRAVFAALEELCARLRAGVPESQAFRAFRAAAAPRYEAFAAGLRVQRIAAPTLRPQNYARSVMHLVSGLVAAAAIVLAPSWGMIIGIAAAFFTFAWTMEIGRRRSARWNRFAMRLFARVAHPHEEFRVNSATWYATALLALALTLDPVACLLAVLTLAFGDPAAAWFGRRFGRIRLRAGRSLEGSLAFIVVAFAVGFAALTAFHGGLAVPSALLLAGVAATAGAIAELYSGRVDDNLAIPVVVGVATALVLAMG